MKLLTHPATTALGLTLLYLFARVGELLSSRHIALYHWSGSDAALFLPVLCIFGLLWIVLASLLSVARKPGRRSAAIWSAAILPLPYVLYQGWALRAGRAMPHWSSMAACGLMAAAFLIIVAGWKPSCAPWFERVRNLLATAIGFVAITSLFVLGHLFWLGWQARNVNAPLPLHQEQSVSASTKTRIVWILFDELSYRQVYERRFPGLQLPAFDRLAAEATLFTHVIPAGTLTEDVVPSLFTAQPVDRIMESSDGPHLSLHNPVSGAWQPFDPHRTVFQDALDAGYSTAVAGWYNPYCRILPQVLDQCSWAFNMTTAGASPARTLGENLLEPLHHAFAFVLSLRARLTGTPVFNRRETSLHQLDYTRLYSAADHLLNDPSANFIYLHMPIPHPGGIYDRTTGNFATTHSTYIDNLALTDKYLAHVRAVLEQNGTWDSSVIVIMGDHSWRTSFIWSSKPSWTHEEQVASDGGQFDDRPAYIVKLPHQQQPARIDFPYAAIHTRPLLDALIRNQIRSTGDLSAWAAAWNDPGSNTREPAAIASR